MNVRRSLLGLTFCTCYLASHLTNKVADFHWWSFASCVMEAGMGGDPQQSKGSDVLTWLPASVLFVGIIYAGSKALSRLAVPVFFILHNVAEVLTCGYQKCVWKEGHLKHRSQRSVGDLFGALDFPFLYFYRFHGSCCASGVFGFLLMLSTVKLRGILTPEQCAAWIFFAKSHHS
ncbi:Transmembrane protein 241 [Apodemus speciosus]|uniref:Transmembrane protein 241 n=1 Tax=Apodemus speciosus TaxID=105296 RepID=A0ABQ0FQD0_APOSI